MAYYRNSLLNALFDESVAALALISFGIHTAYTEGVELSRLIEEMSFLQSVLRYEIIDFEEPGSVIQKMQALGVVVLSNTKVKGLD